MFARFVGLALKMLVLVVIHTATFLLVASQLPFALCSSFKVLSFDLPLDDAFTF